MLKRFHFLLMISGPFFYITLELHQVHVPGQIGLCQECDCVVHTGHLGSFVHSLRFGFLGTLDDDFPDLSGEGLVRISKP